MATPTKGQSLTECLQVWNKFAKDNSSCDYTYHMSIIEWNDSIRREISEMIAKGITSFKMYMAYDNLRVTDGELFEAMLELKKFRGCWEFIVKTGTW